MSGEHSCAGSSGKSPDHAGECANPQPDPVSPGETTFMASTPKSRWQRIRPPASPVVAGRGVARTSVKIDKSPSPMAPKLSKRSLDSPLEGDGFELSDLREMGTVSSLRFVTFLENPMALRCDDRGAPNPAAARVSEISWLIRRSVNRPNGS